MPTQWRRHEASDATRVGAGSEGGGSRRVRSARDPGFAPPVLDRAVHLAGFVPCRGCRAGDARERLATTGIASRSGPLLTPGRIACWSTHARTSDAPAAGWAERSVPYAP